ncbi:MAG: MYXO-CTERM sorting domain-containing protein [Myxococcales bacterium]
MKNNGASVDGVVQVMLRGPGANDLTLKNCGDPTAMSLPGSGQVASCSASWTATQVGTYEIAVGVFAAGWSPMLDWNNAAGTFTVAAAGLDAGALVRPDSGTETRPDSGAGSGPDAGPVTGDGGTRPAADGAMDPGPVTQGCGCSATNASPLAMALAAMSLVVARRRRR